MFHCSEASYRTTALVWTKMLLLLTRVPHCCDGVLDATACWFKHCSSCRNKSADRLLSSWVVVTQHCQAVMLWKALLSCASAFTVPSGQLLQHHAHRPPPTPQPHTTEKAWAVSAASATGPPTDGCTGRVLHCIKLAPLWQLYTQTKPT
jgi:hypothetical protein